MGIQAVIFDLGGVLFRLGEAEYRREVALRLGLGEALPEYYEQQMPALQRGEVSEQAVWEAMSGLLVESTAFDDIWETHFIPDPAMLGVAKEFRDRGLKTAVLSNTQASHVAIMRRMGVLAPFDQLFMSCEVGRRKPEPEVFALALERLGVSASSAVFIDDVPAYVEAARACGLHGLLHAGDVAATRSAVLKLV